MWPRGCLTAGAVHRGSATSLLPREGNNAAPQWAVSPRKQRGAVAIRFKRLLRTQASHLGNIGCRSKADVGHAYSCLRNRWSGQMAGWQGSECVPHILPVRLLVTLALAPCLPQSVRWTDCSGRRYACLWPKMFRLSMAMEPAAFPAPRPPRGFALLFSPNTWPRRRGP